MKNPPYSIQLTGQESLLMLASLAAFVALIFGFIPAIRRSGEVGRNALYTCRATWSYGSRLMKQYASFCRVTAYDDFLQVVFLTATRYEYKKMRNIRLTSDFGGTLEMDYEGCMLSFGGSAYNMKQLYSYLIERTEK